MAKFTRKHAANKHNSTRRFPKFMGTSHGIHKWSNAMFEKLGWMVIAKAKGYDVKVAEYKKSLTRLLETIKHVSAEYENMNRKHDLNVTRVYVEHLRDYVMKHL